MIRGVDLVSITTSMGTLTKESGRIMSVMAEGHISMLQLAPNMLECGMMENGKVMVN